ncbi:MAG: GHKL domain-containing protein [Candidatus Anstonellales archaeon]
MLCIVKPYTYKYYMYMEVVILGFISSMIDVYGVYLLCKNTVGVKVRNVVNLVYYVCVVVLSYVMRCMYSVDSRYMVLYNLVYIILIYAIIRYSSVDKTIKNWVVLFVYLVINIVVAVVLYILGYGLSIEQKSLLASVMILYIIYKKLLYVRVYSELCNMISLISKVKIGLYGMLFYLIVSIAIVSIYMELHGNVVFEYILFMFIVYTVFSMYIMLKAIVDKVMSDEQVFIVDSYGDVINSIKEFMHNYNNVINSLNACIDSGVNECVIDVIGDLSKRHEEFTRGVEILNISHPIVASVIKSKMNYANMLGVDLSIKSVGTGNINMRYLDLIQVLGVLYDNAIEVAYYSDLKVVDTSIIIDNGVCYIGVFNKKAMDKEGNILKYGKSNGIGLKSVKSILSRYSNVTLNINDGSDYYLVEMIIR